ncbi:hypothetical protein B0H21DRAFT_755530 [Amylocystis lapponica]|nr:hypothetical protein B0H21DRAFT_755530 [Amylocystis lapponica]
METSDEGVAPQVTPPQTIAMDERMEFDFGVVNETTSANSTEMETAPVANVLVLDAIPEVAIPSAESIPSTWQDFEMRPDDIAVSQVEWPAQLETTTTVSSLYLPVPAPAAPQVAAPLSEIAFPLASVLGSTLYGQDSADCAEEAAPQFPAMRSTQIMPEATSANVPEEVHIRKPTAHSSTRPKSTTERARHNRQSVPSTRPSPKARAQQRLYGNPSFTSTVPALLSGSGLGELTLFGCGPAAEAKASSIPNNIVSVSATLTPLLASSPLASNAPPSATLASSPETGREAFAQLIRKLEEVASSAPASSLEVQVGDGPQLTEGELSSDVRANVKAPLGSRSSVPTVVGCTTAMPVTVIAAPLSFHDSLGRLSHLDAPPRNPFASPGAAVHTGSGLSAVESGTTGVMQARKTCIRGVFNAPCIVADTLRDIASVEFRTSHRYAEPVRKPVTPLAPSIPSVHNSNVLALDDGDNGDDSDDGCDSRPPVADSRPREAFSESDIRSAGFASSAGYMLGKAIGRTLRWCIQMTTLTAKR